MGDQTANAHMASQKGVSFASSELLTPVRIISPTPNNQWHVNWGGCNFGSNDRKLCAVAMCKHPFTITDGLSKEMRIIRLETPHKWNHPWTCKKTQKISDFFLVTGKERDMALTLILACKSLHPQLSNVSTKIVSGFEEEANLMSV